MWRHARVTWEMKCQATGDYVAAKRLEGSLSSYGRCANEPSKRQGPSFGPSFLSFQPLCPGKGQSEFLAGGPKGMINLRKAGAMVTL
jgi:hypothetical protein